MKPLSVYTNVEAVEDVLDDLAEREGDNRQIVAVQAKDGNADDDACDCRDKRARDDRRQKAERGGRDAALKAHRNDNAGKRPDAHKPGMSKAQLT